MLEKYNSTPDYQDRILACIIKHPERFTCYTGVLNSAYFSGLPRIVTARTMFGYCKKHNRYPAWDVLVQKVYDAIERTSESKEEESIMDYLKRLKDMDTGDIDSVVEDVITFARKRAYLIALEEAFQFWQEGKEPSGGFESLFKAAAQVGVNFQDYGYIIGPNREGEILRVIEEYLDFKPGIQLGAQWHLLDGVWKNKGGVRPGWLIAILAPPKRYKCEHPDTEILMYDGTVKRICEVKVGDQIMGDDSTPRVVLSCGYGYGPMYRVTQANGDNYTVNSDHVLCLQRPEGTEPTGRRFRDRYHRGQFLEITAKEYAHKSKWFQRTWKGYKVGVEFPSVAVLLDAYFLGLWLGDGTLHEPAITVGDDDPEILGYLSGMARDESTKVRISRRKTRCVQFHFVRKPGLRNPVADKLRAIGVFDFKHVPYVYKINERAVRLQVLAGLIDSDGNHTKNRGFIFVNTNEQLCKDVCWLSRSLGFKSFIRKVKTRCSVKGKHVCSVAFRTYIQGKISEIPTRVARKRGKDSAKATRRTTIKVKPVGNGQWFGIEIDGNRKYLHSDFTVTHNTTLCVNLALSIAYGGKPVFYYPCEITQVDAAIRAFQCLTDCSDALLMKNPQSFTELTIQKANETMGAPLLIKGFPLRSASIGNEIRSHALTSKQQLGIQPAAIFIDHAECLHSSSTKKDLSDHRAQGEIYVEAKNLALEMGCPVFLPDRCDAETMERVNPTMKGKGFQGAMEKMGHVDAGIALYSSENEYLENQYRAFIFLNRHGKAGLHFRGIVNPETQRMTLDSEIPWSPDDDNYDEKKKSGGKNYRRQKRKGFDPAKVLDD